MIFNKPDLNAPRFRPKRYNLLNVNFCNKIKEKNENCKDLTNNQIKEVIKTFNNNIWESVIEKRDGVELLEQLIKETKAKGAPDNITIVWATIAESNSEILVSKFGAAK